MITTYEQTIKAIKQLPPEDVAQDYVSTSVYIRVSKESRALIEQYAFRSNVQTFVDEIEHDLWFDIPFMKQPCTFIEELSI